MKTEILDQETIESLRELSDGSDELLADLITVFLEEAPSRMKLIEDSIAAGDAKQVAFGAHKLRGGAQALGAIRLSEVLDEVESAARSNDLDSVALRIPDIRTELADATSELKRLIS